MQQRLPTLGESQLAFAHRGARDRAPENTLEAFTVALSLGATGLETDVWVTRDGHAVLDHDGVVRTRLRNRPIAGIARADLPAHIPLARELLDLAPPGTHISVDIKDAGALAPLLRDITESGVDPDRMWLCSPDTDVLALAGAGTSGVRLVHSTRLGRLAVSPEVHCARLAAAGVDALNLHHTEWTGGLTVMSHRFGVHAFAWDVQQPAHMETILRMGVDAVYSDHADMMMTMIEAEAAARNAG